MTDDQGHNDTAVPPKTTSAKEAAPRHHWRQQQEKYTQHILYMYNATVRKILQKKYKTFWNICYGQ